MAIEQALDPPPPSCKGLHTRNVCAHTPPPPPMKILDPPLLHVFDKEYQQSTPDELKFLHIIFKGPNIKSTILLQNCKLYQCHLLDMGIFIIVSLKRFLKGFKQTLPTNGLSLVDGKENTYRGTWAFFQSYINVNVT